MGGGDGVSVKGGIVRRQRINRNTLGASKD